MTDTKENILMTALYLFARDGYEAVSVSAIAGELGMTKGALYRHYKNKRDIFDSIVERMYQIDAQRSQAYEVPKEKYEIEPEAYKPGCLDKICCAQQYVQFILISYRPVNRNNIFKTIPANHFFQNY